MEPLPLITKLRLRSGQRIALLNPPPGYLAQLGDLPLGAMLVAEPEDGSCDLVQLFAVTAAELHTLFAAATRACKYDGLLWVSYPKRSAKTGSELNRDVIWELLASTGYRPVTQIALDDVWSALRYRPADRVGKA